LFRSRKRPPIRYDRRLRVVGSGRRRRRSSGPRLNPYIPGAVFVGFMLMVGIAEGFLGKSAPAFCQTASIADCYDGDTCKAFVGGRVERVRLIGFDTPELAPRARCRAEHALGIEARNQLNAMIRAGGDRIFCTDGREWPRDSYGRLLAVLLIDGRDVGPIMLDRGLAVPYPLGHSPNWCG